MPRARASNACRRDSGGTRVSARPPPLRTTSTAKDDFPAPARNRSTLAKENSDSFRFLLPVRLALSIKVPQQLLRFLHVIQRQLPRFNQVRHYRLRTAAKQRQQIVDQFPLRIAARN